METKRSFWAILIVCVFMPFFNKAQSLAKRADSSSDWNALKLDDGGNAIKNVFFYSQKVECYGEQLLLLKAINKNEFPVKIQWQAAPDAPVSEETIPARTKSAGSCPLSQADKKGGMVLTNISAAGVEQRNAPVFFLSHLTVTELKDQK